MPPAEHMTGANPGPPTGRTLGDLLREHGTVAPAETMRILAEAADALDFAHSKGLAHRELTADSIRVETNGAVRLTGLAVGDGGANAETAVIDADAEFSQADADADVLALAAIGYRCLTGRMLDRAAPQPFPPQVPPVVGHPLWLSLGIDPDTRIPSAAKFAQLCRGAIAGLGITTPMRPAAMSAPSPAGPPPPAAMAAPKRRRQGLLVAGVIAAVLLLTAGGLLVVLQPWADGNEAFAGGSKDDGGSGQSTSSADPKNSASRGDPDKSKSSTPSPSNEDDNDSGDGNGGGGDDGGGGGDDGGGGDNGGGGGEDDIYSGPMPDVVGMTVKQAYEAIVTEAYVQTDVNYSSSDPTCIVHTQYPSPGTHLDENSEPSITADGSAGDCGF